MSPILLAALLAGAVALVVFGVGGAVVGWRRSTDRRLERRLRRVAAPLATPAVGETPGSVAESVFRGREKRARLGWVWRPIERRYPLVHPPRALALAGRRGLRGGRVHGIRAVVPQGAVRMVDDAGGLARGHARGLAGAQMAAGEAGDRVHPPVPRGGGSGGAPRRRGRSSR